MGRWSWAVFILWEWFHDRRQKRRAAKRLADMEKRRTSEAYVIERQREFEERVRKDIKDGEPYAVRGCSAHIYRYLMCKWFDKLADQSRHDGLKLRKLRRAWLVYIEALEASKASSYLSVELDHWAEREKYDLQAQEEKAKLAAIQDAFAEAIGPEAVERLRGTRAMRWDTFSDEGELVLMGHRTPNEPAGVGMRLRQRNRLI